MQKTVEKMATECGIDPRDKRYVFRGLNDLNEANMILEAVRAYKDHPQARCFLLEPSHLT